MDGEELADLDSFHLSASRDDPTRILGTYCNAWWSDHAYGSPTNWRHALGLYQMQIDTVPVQEESEFFVRLDEILWDVMEVRRGRGRTWEKVADISDRVEDLEVFLEASELSVVPEPVVDGVGWLHSWVRCVKSRTDAQLVIYMLTSRARAAVYACGGSGTQLGMEAVSGALSTVLDDSQRATTVERSRADRIFSIGRVAGGRPSFLQPFCWTAEHMEQVEYNSRQRHHDRYVGSVSQRLVGERGRGMCRRFEDDDGFFRLPGELCVRAPLTDLSINWLYQMGLDRTDIRLVSTKKKILKELNDIVADIQISDINASRIIQVVHAANEIRCRY